MAEPPIISSSTATVPSNTSNTNVSPEKPPSVSKPTAREEASTASSKADEKLGQLEVGIYVFTKFFAGFTIILGKALDEND